MYEQKFFVLKYNYFFKRSMKILQMPQNLRDTLYSKQSIRRFSHHLFKKCPANFRTSYLLREGAEGLKIFWGGQTVIQGLSMELVYASNSAKIGSAGALHVEMGFYADITWYSYNSIKNTYS